MYRKYFRTRSNRAHSVRLSCFQVRMGVGVVSKLGPDLSCNRMSTATTSGLPTTRPVTTTRELATTKGASRSLIRQDLPGSDF
jgi:ribosomal protein L34E